MIQEHLNLLHGGHVSSDRKKELKKKESKNPLRKGYIKDDPFFICTHSIIFFISYNLQHDALREIESYICYSTTQTLYN